MKSSDVVDRILSVSAIISAIAAVAIAAYEARIDRDYQRISVWPYVSQFNTHPPGENYTRNVKNSGIGPARVRSYQVRVDDKLVRTRDELFQRTIGEAKPRSFLTYSSFGNGDILLPGETVTLLTLRGGAEADSFHAAIGRVSTRVCYCSLYDECWIDDSTKREPTPVRQCLLEPDLDFMR